MPSPSTSSNPERRREPRLSLCRPIKLWCAQTGRYLGGQTCNVSSGGALVTLAQSTMVAPGQRVRLGVAWNDRQPLLASAGLLDATVVRHVGSGAEQQVAVRFDRPLAMAG